MLEEFLHEAIVGFEPPLKQLRQSEEEVGAAVDGDGEDVALEGSLHLGAAVGGHVGVACGLDISVAVAVVLAGSVTSSVLVGALSNSVVGLVE